MRRDDFDRNLPQKTYVFDGANHDTELTRLRLIESIFDEKTLAWLKSSGPLENRRCLEVGAGAGSIAAWMAEEVGPEGSVVAVDTNARYLNGLRPRVDVMETAFGDDLVAAESVDVVHARYVLIHNPRARSLLEPMVRALKPGGALVLEEPDFGAAVALAGDAPLAQSFERVAAAVNAMFEARGLNGAFGRLLPEAVGATNLVIEAVDYDAHVARGGSAIAEMMRLSTAALRDKYVATGLVTEADVERHAEFAASPRCWGVYYATVRVLARKPA